ncbi:MAG: DUF3224 domain-containing protein [Kutzneria sp.]|nr:DUF3224 domain-containing protein [Kutzneria sp.]MBV9845204.1 DUF3224 domain-containing protein [Kutzneria sp.]
MRKLFVLTTVLAQITIWGTTAASAQAHPSPRQHQVAEGSFIVTHWTSEPYQTTPDGATLSRFSCTDTIQGDVRGDGSAEAQMFNRLDGGTSYAGMILITGQLAGRSGSFIVQTVGTSVGTASSSTWTVVPGSGTGELRDLRGDGVEIGSETEGWRAHYRLDYYFQ